MYREVRMVELKEVLRLRGEGLPKSASPRSSISIRKPCGVISSSRRLPACGPRRTRSGTRTCERCSSRYTRLGAARVATAGPAARSSRRAIERWLHDGLRLTEVRKLARQGVSSPIRRSTALPCWSCSLAAQRRRSRCSTASPDTSCSSIPAGSAGSRCCMPNGAGFAHGSLPRSVRAIASSIPHSRKPRCAPSRRARRPEDFSAASSRSLFRTIPRRSSRRLIRSRPASRRRFLSTPRPGTFISIPPACVMRATEGSIPSSGTIRLGGCAASLMAGHRSDQVVS